MGLERYLCIGGVEVANSNRTLAYMRNLGNYCLPAPPPVGCCDCLYDPEAIYGPGTIVDPEAVIVGEPAPAPAAAPDVPSSPVYTTPVGDDAPWYDPAVPASAEVLGVWIEEARLGSAWQRDVRQRRWGGTLGPAQQPARELTVIGWVYTRSPAATAYARQWLFEALQGGSCSEGGCSLPDALVYTYCDPEGARWMKRVGLTGWDPDIEPEFPRKCGFKFEAVLTAEVPHLITAPFDTVEALLVDGVPTCTLCSPCPDLEPDPLACGCALDDLRVVPQGDDVSCYCLPVDVYRTYRTTETPLYWSDAVAVVTVDAGNSGDSISNLRIRGWPNPVGIDPVDADPVFDCQEPCLDIEVSCIPGRSRLVIDATTRTATIVGAGQSVGAHGYLTSGGGGRFSWPEVSCYGLMIAIDADAANTPADATVTIELVNRERG